MKRLLTIILYMIFAIYGFAADEIVSFRLTKLQGGLPDNNVRQIFQDSIGYIYFTNQYGVCMQYDGYSFQLLSPAIWKERQSRLCQRPDYSKPGWSGDSNPLLNANLRHHAGHIIYNNKSTGKTFDFSIVDGELLKATDNLKDKTLIDHDGRVWASVNGNGVFIYNPANDNLRHITCTDAHKLIDSDYIIDMMADRDGNVWVTMETAGVVCLRAVSPQYSTRQLIDDQRERANCLRMIRQLPDGTVLMCVGNGFLLKADSTLTTFSKPQQMGTHILCAATDAQGRLWLGSRLKGISVAGKWYSEGRVDDILQDRKGRMWFCGLKNDVVQATLTANGRWQERHCLKQIEGLRPHTLLLDRKGCIVVGGEGGVLRFNPDELLKDTSRYEWLTREPVVPLLEDSKGRLWAGTHSQGLLRLDNGTRITAADGLASNIVQSLVEDKHGRICVTTHDGCTFYNPETGRMQQLYFYDNIQRNFFMEKASLMLPDGRIVLGNRNEMVVVNSDYEVQAKTDNRSLNITHITINGTSYYQHPELCEQLGTNISAISQLELPHDQNTLTISFSDFDYASRSAELYSYRLDGVDRDWCEGTTINTATYQNLRPGKYKFWLRRQTADGQWTEGQMMMMITILPPWYLTWWALCIFALLLLIAAWWVYRQLREQYLLRKAVAVEKQLTEYKLKFFTNISHEFRTPLTLIQGSMDHLSQLPDAVAQAHAPLSNMQRNVDRLMRLINQLLEFRRMQNNKLSLSLEDTEIVAFVRELCQGFHDAAEQKRIALTFVPSVKSLNVFIDRGFIDKAVYNLLSNAFKYTLSGGSVTARLKVEEDNLKIIVEDTGPGVPEEMREKIFDRFQRGQIGRDSLGIGLDLTAELIRTHHGTIRCDENPGGGSIFTITLPTDSSVYQESDFLKVDSMPAEAQQEQRSYTEPVREMTGKPMNDRRILVIEDDADIQAYLRQELSNYFLVETASDGEEALEKIEKEESNLQLIITDVMMPRMNGYELLSRLRRDERTKSIPVIMLTALTAADKQMHGLEAGADAYITKPFSMQLLVAQCRSLIEQRDRYRDAFAQEVRRPKNTAPQVVTDKRDERLLRQLEVYIDSHLSDSNLSAESFAEDMKMGRTLFFNKVKQLTGQTPNEFIRERRLSRACQLLDEGGINISEVAYQVGMKTPNYFSECFKKRFGITPKQYQMGGNISE